MNSFRKLVWEKFSSYTSLIKDISAPKVLTWLHQGVISSISWCNYFFNFLITSRNYIFKFLNYTHFFYCQLVTHLVLLTPDDAAVFWLAKFTDKFANTRQKSFPSWSLELWHSRKEWNVGTVFNWTVVFEQRLFHVFLHLLQKIHSC